MTTSNLNQRFVSGKIKVIYIENKLGFGFINFANLIFEKLFIIWTID